jgi:flagellar hook-associated protein 3 FlgL
MRVATSTFNNEFIDQLNLLQQNQLRLQNQAATGQKLTLPEDDPAAMQRVLNLQAESLSNTQYQNNIAALQNKATSTYGAINGLKTISDRAGEIATLADGTKSPQDLAAYATEVNGLIQQAVQLANTKYQGDYILAGTATGAAPFVATTDSSGNVTAVTYQGNTSVAQSEIAPNVTATAQTLGANTTGSGPRGLITDSHYGADFLNHLIALRNDLQAGNTAAIAATDHPALAKDEDNFLFHISANGTLQAQLTATNNLAAQHGTDLDGQISQNRDADIAQTITQLKQAQTAYSAALQSGSSILNLSLLNYLH